MDFWMITAVRKDGSTQVKQHISREVANAIAVSLLGEAECRDGLDGVHVDRCDPRADYCSRSPVLPLDDALRFSQPPDLITHLLR